MSLYGVAVADGDAAGDAPGTGDALGTGDAPGIGLAAALGAALGAGEGDAICAGAPLTHTAIRAAANRPDATSERLGKEAPSNDGCERDGALGARYRKRIVASS